MPLFQVQFGHAGASAHGDNETAIAKNKVPFQLSFFFGRKLAKQYRCVEGSHTHTAAQDTEMNLLVFKVLNSTVLP